MPYPPRIESIPHLDELLSEPTLHAIDTLGELDGDLMLLGVAGKMGPTLARMARIASDQAGVQRRTVRLPVADSPLRRILREKTACAGASDSPVPPLAATRDHSHLIPFYKEVCALGDCKID